MSYEHAKQLLRSKIEEHEQKIREVYPGGVENVQDVEDAQDLIGTIQDDIHLGIEGIPDESLETRTYASYLILAEMANAINLLNDVIEYGFNEQSYSELDLGQDKFQRTVKNLEKLGRIEPESIEPEVQQLREAIVSEFAQNIGCCTKTLN